MDLNEKTLGELAGLLKVKDWAMIGGFCVVLAVAGYYVGGFIEKNQTERVRSELSDTKRSLEQAKMTAAKAESEKQAAERTLADAKKDADAEASALKTRLKQAEANRTAAEKAANDAEAALKARTTEVGDTDRTLKATKADLTAAQAELARLQKIADDAKAALEASKKEMATLKDRLEERAKTLADDTVRRAEARSAAEIKVLTERLKETTAALQSSQNKVLALTATVESLQAAAAAKKASEDAAVSNVLLPKGSFDLVEGTTRDITDANLLIGLKRGRRGCIELTANGNEDCLEVGHRYDLKWPHAPFHLDRTFSGKRVCFLDVAGLDTSGAKAVATLRLKCD